MGSIGVASELNPFNGGARLGENVDGLPVIY